MLRPRLPDICLFTVEFSRDWQQLVRKETAAFTNTGTGENKDRHSPVMAPPCQNYDMAPPVSNCSPVNPPCQNYDMAPPVSNSSPVNPPCQVVETD